MWICGCESHSMASYILLWMILSAHIPLHRKLEFVIKRFMSKLIMQFLQKICSADRLRHNVVFCIVHKRFVPQDKMNHGSTIRQLHELTIGTVKLLSSTTTSTYFYFVLAERTSRLLTSTLITSFLLLESPGRSGQTQQIAQQEPCNGLSSSVFGHAEWLPCTFAHCNPRVTRDAYPSCNIPSNARACEIPPVS
jgi:hypothetical protein